MPFIPHTDTEVAEMLAAIGVNAVDDLFDEIPDGLRIDGLEGVPAGLSEMEVAKHMAERAAQDAGTVCFIGAGAYDHHVPAAVWELATRGEFYSAYTPYQAEASQGTLQVAYEFQSMMARLTGLDVSNASLYDGATALAEAALMAVRLQRRAGVRRLLMPETVHPIYRAVVHSIVKNQGIELIPLAYDPQTGQIDGNGLTAEVAEGIAALVLPQPNFFGVLEDVDALTDWAHAHNLLVIGLVNPVSLAVLNPPGSWGKDGADIACGEGQPLGVPLASGGPYFGFMTCRQAHMRQLPGRIVGRTVDMDGKQGFTLTLQAREQHIRRSKATSNICTNQGLLATAAAIHMSLMGPDGLARAASGSHANTRALLAALTAIDGVEAVFSGPYFHEAVIRLPAPVDEVLPALAARNLLAGYPLGEHYPALQDCLLICATEKRTAAEVASFAELLARVLEMRTRPQCPVQPKI